MLKTQINKYYKRPENNGLEMTTTPYKIRVYKIWYEDCPEEFYIGSTKKQYLSERMGWHRKDCRKARNMSKLYTLMREKGINNFKHVQIAWANVSCIDEQRQIEQTYIDKLKPSLNMKKSYISNEDKKNYRERTKNIKTCICGSELNYGRKYAKDKHYASKKHQEYGKLLRIKLLGYLGE